MKAPGDRVREEYLSMVISFLSRRNEAGLHEGYELGRSALESRLGVLEVAEAYVMALSEVLKPISPESANIVVATREVLSASLAPFEMTHRGYQDSISRLQKMNKDLEAQAQELTTVNQELEAFSYTVSHDVRSPISGIGSLAKIMLDEYGSQLDGTGKEYLSAMIASAEQTVELVEGLLSLSQFSRQELVQSSVDLGQIARAVIRDLQKEKNNRNVVVSIADKMIVQGDSQLLYAVVSNLLMNAWKYTAKRTEAKIEFAVLVQDGKPVYFVKDNGAGFDMKSASKLFSPFQRLHSASQFQGTGVGLATVRRIIERHGGRIWAEAKVDQGATFYFAL